MRRNASAAAVARLSEDSAPENTSHPFVDALNDATVADVPIKDINLDDLTFQYRFKTRAGALCAAIARQGQEEPVHLTNSKPHRIIDGFQRVNAIRDLGWPTVKAFVHHGITDEKAHEIAFTQNTFRTNLTPIDKANAIVLARKRGLKDDAIARLLGMSERQLHRYAGLLEFQRPIQELVDANEISMAHAAVLSKFDGINLVEWVERTIDKKWSATELRRELRKSQASSTSSKPRALIKVGREDCRLLARHFSRTTSTEELTVAVEALERFVGILQSWLDQRLGGNGNEGIESRRTTTKLGRSDNPRPSPKTDKRSRKVRTDAAGEGRR